VGSATYGFMAPSVVRPRRKERCARLTHRRGRVLGGPSVRAAYGGSLSLPWLPRRVVPRLDLWDELSPRGKPAAGIRSYGARPPHLLAFQRTSESGSWVTSDRCVQYKPIAITESS
jgi:hypothetical protein